VVSSLASKNQEPLASAPLTVTVVALMNAVESVMFWEK
jgi:hypothetical protein